MAFGGARFAMAGEQPRPGPGLLDGAASLVRYGPAQGECRARLREVASRSGGAEVGAVAAAGKLLRATLVLAVGSPLGAARAALVPAAVTVELLHFASLVHDDIIDGATERRGAPALHVSAGRDRALVLGDLLIAAAFDVVGEVRAPAGAEAFGRAVEVLSTGAQRCCVGQLEELEARDRPLSEERYLDVVEKKTGSLFATAALLGGVVGGASDEELAPLAALGRQLGVAYQVRDDRRDRVDDRPAPETYFRVVEAARRGVDAVPAACREGLRALGEAILSVDSHSLNGRS
jgi:geranylgeranyl pyrophosphate synthase